MSESVNHPKHYGGEHNPYEHIKVCDAWGLDYRLGNCTKYICRAGKKGNNALEDLKKAAWYLNDAIKQLEPIKPATGLHPYPDVISCIYCGVVIPRGEGLSCQACETAKHKEAYTVLKERVKEGWCQCEEHYAVHCVNCGRPPYPDEHISEPTKAVHDG